MTVMEENVTDIRKILDEDRRVACLNWIGEIISYFNLVFKKSEIFSTVFSEPG